MQVKKRNGEIQEFDFQKIKDAVNKAFVSTGRTGAPNIFFENLEHWFNLICKQTDNILTVESIQNIVETQLMYEKYFEVAKAYILYRAKHEESRFIKERIDYMNQYSESSNNAASSSE